VKPESLSLASLMIVARIVVAMIPISRSPRTRRARSTIVKTRPNSVTKTGHVVSGARSTTVPSPRTTRPELTRPMNAMKSPIPIAIAFFRSSGIASRIRSRMPVNTRIVTAIPSTTTSPIAAGNERPSPATRPNATTALRPRPGAIA
jgi:hypothetical protein